MKLIITGGTGLIGAALVDRLWARSHSLALLTRQPPAETGVVNKEWFSWRPGTSGAWEQAAERLESGDLPLDDSLAAFEKGVGLVNFCNHKLNEVEKKLSF